MIQQLTGTRDEIVAFMNDSGLTLANVTMVNEGTTNRVVMFYDDDDISE